MSVFHARPRLLPATADPDPWEEFRRELERCRRFEHPFSLVRVRDARGLQNGAGARGAGDELGKFRSLLRVVDRVWTANGSTYLLLPETDRPLAQALLARMQRDVPGLLNGKEVSLAAFPVDGLTAHALLARIHERSGAVEARPADRLAEDLALAYAGQHGRVSAPAAGRRPVGGWRELRLRRRVEEPLEGTLTSDVLEEPA